MNTGMIGLGAMGWPMAARLHAAGHLSTVWNRTAEGAQRFAREHSTIAAQSPREVAHSCDAILISVTADEQVHEVINALMPKLRPGTVIIDTSTTRADTATTLARQVKDGGGDFLDAPVSGGVEGAKNGRLAMMVGGEAPALDKVYPLLECLASRIIHMGPSGAGQATKAVNQIMAAGINQAVTEALAFGQAMGLDMDKVIDVVGGGAAGNWFLDHRGASMLAGRYEPGFKVALHHKDLAICKHMAQQLDVQLPVIEMTLIHYQRLIDAGYGDDDISALYRHKQWMFSEGI